MNVPRAPITYSTFIFHSFFYSLARSRTIIIFIFFLLLESFSHTYTHRRTRTYTHKRVCVCVCVRAPLCLRECICVCACAPVCARFLADGLSLKFEWLQVSSCLQDSSQYSDRSQKYSSLGGFHSSYVHIYRYRERDIWFCLVSLFNGISTFADNLLPKPSL